MLGTALSSVLNLLIGDRPADDTCGLLFFVCVSKLLERILKTSEENLDAAGVEESDVVFDEVLIAGGDAAELLQPGEQTFDLPASFVASQWSPVLRLDDPVGLVGGNQFHPAFPQQAFV